MSSPLAAERESIEPNKLSKQQRRQIRGVVAAIIAGILIIALISFLFATGLVLIPTGTLSPSLAQTTLYISRGGLDVTALRASDGSVLWRHLGGGWYTAASDGLVFTSSTDDASVFALRGSDGSRVWTAFSIGDVLAASNGLVVVGSFDGQDPSHIQVLNTADGSTRWSYQLDGINRPNATLAGSTVYAYGSGSAGNPASGDVLYALRATDGALLWKATTPASSTPAPAAGDGAVYVADNSGYVNAMSATDGSLLWHVQIGEQGSGTSSSLATSPGVVYASSFDGSVVALSAATGATLWQDQVNPVTPPTVAGGVIYVNTRGGDLLALNASDGTTRWSTTVYGPLANYGEPRPLVVGNGVFEGVSGYCTLFCRPAFVYGVQASNGAVAWRYTSPGQITALVAV